MATEHLLGFGQKGAFCSMCSSSPDPPFQCVCLCMCLGVLKHPLGSLCDRLLLHGVDLQLDAPPPRGVWPHTVCLSGERAGVVPPSLFQGVNSFRVQTV